MKEASLLGRSLGKSLGLWPKQKNPASVELWFRAGTFPMLIEKKVLPLQRACIVLTFTQKHECLVNEGTNTNIASTYESHLGVFMSHKESERVAWSQVGSRAWAQTTFPNIIWDARARYMNENVEFPTTKYYPTRSSFPLTLSLINKLIMETRLPWAVWPEWPREPSHCPSWMKVRWTSAA